MEKNTVNHSAHSTRRCQYHIVFAPKFRKYRYGSRHFWCRGNYVDKVGKNKKAIEEYICNQLVEDEMMDQMTMKEYTDLFTGIKDK